MSRSTSDRSIELSRVDDIWRGRFFAMGSPCEVLSEASSKSDAQALTQVASDEAWRIEDKFSRYLNNSIVHRINTSNGVAVRVDDETARLLDFAARLYELSDARFDVTSGVLRRVWIFDGSDRVPGAEAVTAVLPLVGWNRVVWDGYSITLPANMEIDLGGIGKEYAVDRAAELVRNASNTGCLVNFGGDLAVSSAPAQRDAWQVGVDARQTPSSATTVISLRAGALATSGDSRRFLLKDGIRYCHILDPATGWPVANSPLSVTVAADTCVEAGMICTMAMLEGSDAESFLQQQALKFWCQRD